MKKVISVWYIGHKYLSAAMDINEKQMTLLI